MHDTREVIELLFKACNIKNRDQEIVGINIKMGELGGKYCAVISFDKYMDSSQRINYLNNFYKEIREKFGTVHFDDTSFPSILNPEAFYTGDDGTVQFMIPIDSGFIFNLKHYLACSFVREARGAVRHGFTTGHIEGVAFIDFDRESYLHGLHFFDTESRNTFIRSFLSEIGEYTDSPSNSLKIDGNNVYVKDIFNDVDFLKSITEETACSIGRDLEIASNEDDENKAFKDNLTNFIYNQTGIMIAGYIRLPYLDSDEDSVNIPTVLNADGSSRTLNKEEVKSINNLFNYPVLNNIANYVENKQSAGLSAEAWEYGVYGIDYCDRDICYYIMNLITENSVIANYGLVINPDARKRSLSFNSADSLAAKRRQNTNDENYANHTNGALPKNASQSAGRLEEQHYVQSNTTSKQIANAHNRLQAPIHHNGWGSLSSTCASSTDSRSVSPLPRNDSDNSLFPQSDNSLYSQGFRDRSNSTGVQGNGTSPVFSSGTGSVSTPNIINSNTNSPTFTQGTNSTPVVVHNTTHVPNKALEIVEEASTSKENSLEHNPPAKSSPVALESKSDPSLKRGSGSRSSLEKAVNSIVTAIKKEISGSWEHKSSSEESGTKVNQQLEENIQKDQNPQSKTKKVKSKKSGKHESPSSKANAKLNEVSTESHKESFLQKMCIIS